MACQALLLCTCWQFAFPFSARGEFVSYGVPHALSAKKPALSVPSAADKRTIKKTSPSGRNTNAVKDVSKRRAAQKMTITNLFRKYNKKLNERQATDYANFIMQASEKFGQDPLVIAAVIVNESTVRHDAISKGGDYGLMQVRWKVHRGKIVKKYPHIKNAKDILNPQYNVLVGTEILSNHMASSQNLRGGLLRYSAGNHKLADKVVAVLNHLESSYLAQLQAL